MRFLSTVKAGDSKLTNTIPPNSKQQKYSLIQNKRMMPMLTMPIQFPFWRYKNE